MSTSGAPLVIADWQDDYWESLLWSLQQGNCILLLGDDAPGISRDLKKQLLNEVLVSNLSSTAGLDFRQVARLYETRNGRSELTRRVCQFYLKHRGDESKMHEQLAAMPFPLIITSCHDTLLAKSFETHPEKRLQIDHYNLRGGQQEVSPFGIKNPLLYHIYGSVDEPASLVLTENDLLDFLVKVTTASPRLPDSLCRELQKPENTFLFLGFGIRRWHLRVLLHVLKLLASGNRSFALEDFEAVNTPELSQAAFFYRNGTRLEIFNGDVAAFISELFDRWQRIGGPTTAPPATGAAEPRSTQPLGSIRVFISYASEDRSPALHVYEGLRQIGLDPWMDKDIEGGRPWNPVIESKIGESDYCVVLISRSLVAKTFSYVNKEIALALDRQQYARSGTYLIPATIEPNVGLLPELARFEAVPALNDSDISSLGSLIKRDYQRRQRQQ